MSFDSSDPDNESDFLHPFRRMAAGYDFSVEEGVDQVKTSSSVGSYSNTHTVRTGTLSLLETCARHIGQNFPFEAVQLHSERVPEELQMKIAYWSFPLDEERLLDYAKMMEVDSAKITRVRRVFDKDLRDSEDWSFRRSAQHTKRDCTDVITKVTQIGMYLSGSVGNLDRHYYSHMHGYEDEQNVVSVQFDRGFITSTMCSCRSSSKWCEHVIALCLARIRGAVPCDLHPPLSETLAHFDRDQLQKMVQHFVQKVPLLGIPPMMEIAGELKKKESEISKQCGAPDVTAGGNLGENARWQIDESIVESQLDCKLDDLIHSHKTASIKLADFENFNIFLQSHDENVVTVLKWILKQMKRKSGNKSSDVDDHRHTAYYNSRTSTDGLSSRTRSQLCLVFIQGIQVFFVDPFVSKACKEDVIHLLQSEEAYTEPTTDVHSRVLLEAVCVGIECPQPTPEYLHDVLCSLQGNNKRKLQDSQCNSQLKDDHLNTFYSLEAVLSYRLFHKKPPSEADASAIFEICKSIFLPSPQASTFGEVIRINSTLEAVPIATILRHGLTLIECLIKSTIDQKQVTEFAAKLLGASSAQIQDVIVACTEETFLAIMQIEEAILDHVQKYITTQNVVIPPALCNMLKEHVCKYPGGGVFTWPWSLLRLASLDSGVIEDVGMTVESLIGNLRSVLYCEGEEGSVYCPVVVAAIRDSFQFLLGYLFKNLPLDCAQQLFTVLSDTLPYPLSNSLNNYDSHLYRVNIITKRLLNEFETECILHGLKEEKPSILPLCDPLWHHQIQNSAEFVQVDASIQSDVLNAVTAMICVKAEHVQFIQKLGKIVEERNYPLSFQLQLLSVRISACQLDLHRSDFNFSVVLSARKLQLGTPGGLLAFRYLVSSWQVFLEPLEVIDLVTNMHKCSTDSGRVGCKEMAQVITEAISRNPNDIVQCLHSQRLEKVIQILAYHDNPEHLLILVDAFETNFNSVAPEDFEQLGRAVGEMFKRVKAQLQVEIIAVKAESDLLSRLGTACVTVLACLVLCMLPNAEPLMSIDIHKWASIVSAVGEDAITIFLKLLQLVHQVQSLKKFSYRFCQDLGILWMEYRQTLPTSSCSILDLAAFNEIAILLAGKRGHVQHYIETHRENAQKVKEALLLVASIYQPLHLENDFAAFAVEMSEVCNAEVKQMIEEQFVHTPLSILEISQEMHDRLSQLDVQSAECCDVRGPGTREPPHAEWDVQMQEFPHSVPDAEMMQQANMQCEPRAREEHEQNVSPALEFGDYHGDWEDDTFS
jgi:hypothetical protein